MAVDTENKRRSVLNVLPAPDGTVGVSDRQQILWVYVGIAPNFTGAWVYIPDGILWLGEWSSHITYDVGEAVTYNDGALLHGFVSRTTHNVGNIPSTAYSSWARIVQPRWNG